MTGNWQEWDSDEFQTALKVVLKCEIQSLLERLSETGEETVLLTASTADRCVDHLASANALKFVNTADIGMIKNKFLRFLTFSGVGAQSPAARRGMPGSSVIAGNSAQSSDVICNNKMGKSPIMLPKSDLSAAKTVDSKAGAAAGEGKNAVKRVLDTGPMSPVDTKRRKIKIETLPQMFTSQPAIPSGSLLPSPPVAVSSVKAQAAAPILKTTKVVSKSGGFTEERFSNTEFQKFLAQYKPNVTECNDEEEEEEEDDDDYDDDDNDDDETIGMFMPQLSQQNQFQHSQVTSVHNALTKLTSVTNKTVSTVNQTGKNQSMQNKLLNQSNDLKKENSSLNVVKFEDKSVNKENKECMRILNVAKTELVTERKELNEEVNASQTSSNKDSDQATGKDQDKVGIVPSNTKTPAGPADKIGSQNRNRLESIDNLDTETLIQMTKAKHLENMSSADREIQAKLGQLSSKLNWVVEYPKGKGKGQPVPAGRGRGSPGQRPQVTEGPGLPTARLGLRGPYHDNQVAEMEGMEDEDFDDDDEFDEDDLDDEDKAALKAMREAHMRKLRNSGNIVEFGDDGGMYAEGFGVSQGFHAYPEGYAEGEEDYEGYEDYNSGEELEVRMGLMRDSNMIHGTLPRIGVPMIGLGEGTNVSGRQPYQRTASPTSENFLMIGPIMAKCLICNKIVRKTEMKLHHESHLNEEYNEEDDEEELEEMDPEDEEAQAFGEQKQAIEEGEFEAGEGEYPPGEGEYPPGESEYQPGEREYPPEEREYPPEESEYPPVEGEYPQDDGDYPPDEGEYSEDYEVERGPEFTAEKFVAEKLDDVSADVARSSKNDNKTTCDICSKSFKSRANMMRHRKNIHNIHEEGNEVNELNQNSPCPCCGKTFRYLNKHMKKMHPDFKESSSAESESSFKCGVCGDQFSDDDTLKEHFKIHT